MIKNRGKAERKNHTTIDFLLQNWKIAVERLYILSATDWENVSNDKGVRFAVRSGMFSVLIFSFAVLSSINNSLSSIMTTIVVGSITIGIIIFEFGNDINRYKIAPALNLIVNFVFIICSFVMILWEPKYININTLQFNIIFFIINGVFLKKRIASILNTFILGITILLCIRGYYFEAADRNLKSLDYIMIAFACITGFFLQQLSSLIQEKSLRYVEAERARILELEKIGRLTVENIQSKESLARMNRISLVETLMSSIAHEVNQPIGSAMIYAEAAQQWLSSPNPNLEEGRAALTGTMSEIRRVGDVIGTIRRLTSRTPTEFDEINLNELISKILKLIDHSLKNQKISITNNLNVSDHTFSVSGNAEEITQVIMNLISNSTDAFDENQAYKEIRVELKYLEDRWIAVSVRDNGKGIDEASLAQIGNNFFTTKIGGSGLGIAICRDISETHGGSLLFTSRVGAGTTATLVLPALE